MMFDAVLFPRAQCTSGEREELISTVRKMVELSEQATREGILALANSAEKSDSFSAAGLRRVVDGVDPKQLHQELAALLASERSHGKALLERMIMAEAIQGINDGLSPRVLELKLLAYLGDHIFLRIMKQRETRQS